MASGAKPGHRMVLHMHNGIEIVIAYFACFFAGMIAVPGNARMKGPEMHYVCEHSGSSIYVGQRELFRELQEIRPRLPDVRQFIVNRLELDFSSGHLAA